MATTDTTAISKSKPEEKFKNVELVYSGVQLILPEGMTCKEGIVWLQRKEAEENQPIEILEDVHTFPLDGAFAFAKALARIHGFTALVPTPGFFGDTPPAMIAVPTGVDTTVQVPWGSMQVPGIDGKLETQVAFDSNRRPIFRIGANVRQRERFKVKKIAEVTRQIVAEESIYKGKALRMKFPDDPRKWSPAHGPSFMDTSKVKEEELIFPDDVADQIAISLFTPIEKTAACIKRGVPLKRGILLEGPYGVGKTQTAYVTAKKAEDNGWTFIYLEDVTQLTQALLFAKAYEPAVVFAEDIDQVIGDQDRNDETNSILNTIDGVVSKNSKVVVVLTTNHVELINKAMLRPGRLDAVVSVSPPDARATERLIRLYARGMVREEENLVEASELMAGQQPASIREVVERSKLAAIRRSTGLEDELFLTGADLAAASKGMVSHLELLKTAEPDTRSDVEKAAATLGDAVVKAAVNSADKPTNGKKSQQSAQQA